MYSLPSVDGMWGIWGSYYTVPTAIFYLLKGECILFPSPEYVPEVLQKTVVDFLGTAPNPTYSQSAT